MKIISSLVCAGCFLAAAALASSPVTLTISNSPGCAIPGDFAGLSFEMANVLSGTNRISGANRFYLFSPTNKPLIALFKTLGVKNLRVGGATVDSPKFPVPCVADIDQLFAFAKAAGVKVIYSFRLLNGDKTNAAFLAKYIWQNYRTQLDCFSIGNEPDWPSYHNQDPNITNYLSYLADWKNFAASIIEFVPGAKFAGPDTGSNFPVPNAQDTDYNGKSWTQLFADDEKKSGIIAAILQHDYVGESAKGVSVSTAIDAMLSQDWDAVNYPTLYQKVLSHVAADGFPFRMTECNDYTRGVNGASNAFASALWSLDYMHWWAARGCAGVNFHNKEWIYTDTIYFDAAGNCRINPKAYGIKAFDLGGHGNVESVAISNPNKINLTAYAVRGAKNLFVTIINKGHGFFARKAKVTILSDAAPKQVEVMLLTGKVGAKTGITLGGAPIRSDGSWNGKWKPLKPDKSGKCIVKVPAASAAIVKFSFE